MISKINIVLFSMLLLLWMFNMETFDNSGVMVKYSLTENDADSIIRQFGIFGLKDDA